MKAVIFDRGCGATTGWTTAITVMPTNDELGDDDKGNVLNSDGLYRTDQEGVRGVNFRVEWRDDKHLKVFHRDNWKHWKAETASGVSLSFEPIENTRPR